VGFVPLLDAAPIIAASERGYFADEGLRVVLERQIGWGNVRDKLVYGQLHASHALFGMPPLSVLDRNGFSTPLVSIMALGTGGDAITLARKWTDTGIDSAESLARRLKPRPAEVPVLAHVFGCSVHHYLFREWLALGGVEVDRDVRLIILPPPQMARQIGAGTVDGFCVGEPWNTVAESRGLGRIVAATTEVLPMHPDKVLAVSRRWLAGHGDQATAVIRAILRSCAFCDAAENRGWLADVLSRPAYLDLPADLLLKSLTAQRWSRGGTRQTDPVRSCAPATTFPSVTQAAWLLGQMVRWGHLPRNTAVPDAARAAVDTAAYRKAAEVIGLNCPSDDAPPMRLKSGSLEFASFQKTLLELRG
jgi:ABC-type nitrate/sulfonate/bicarbonate transport system substrate-binding protein